MTLPEIEAEIGVDSLGYLSVEGAAKIAEKAHCGFCDGCFTGNYPVEIPEPKAKSKFESKISDNKQIKFK